MFLDSTMIEQLSDEELIAEHKRLTQMGWDRAADIAKRRKERHERIDFDNPNFNIKLQEIEQEIKKRGLK